MEQGWKRQFYEGLMKGMPIAFGYLPVSFTFGLIAVNGGLPVWLAIFVSMSNLTSAGQFAGVNLIFANAAYLEIAFTTFVVNIRYALMSLSLSQKIVQSMPLLERCIMAFGITDETFAIASLEEGEITFPYMLGLITGPYGGWVLGTALGALSTSFLPEALQSAMGIALYAMFIAIVVPAAKTSKAALVVTGLGVGLSSLLTWTPGLDQISSGWKIIIATVVAAALGALLYPKDSEEDDESTDSSNLDGHCHLHSQGSTHPCGQGKT